MGKHLLGVIQKSGVVHVHADPPGLRHLVEEFERLIGAVEQDRCEHTHLCSAEWAGHSLGTSMLAAEAADGFAPIHHVKLFAWTGQWAAAHSLDGVEGDA